MMGRVSGPGVRSLNVTSWLAEDYADQTDTPDGEGDSPAPDFGPVSGDEAVLIRRVRFSAGHRYRRPEWSDERNREAFGASVHAHGHNYAVDVRVRGPIDPETGFVVDLGALDRLLAERIVDRLDSRELTETVPEFRPGEEVPSTEALARWVFGQLEDRIPGDARLVRVRVEESGTLAAEYPA